MLQTRTPALTSLLYRSIILVCKKRLQHITASQARQGVGSFFAKSTSNPVIVNWSKHYNFAYRCWHHANKTRLLTAKPGASKVCKDKKSTQSDGEAEPNPSKSAPYRRQKTPREQGSERTRHRR